MLPLPEGTHKYCTRWWFQKFHWFTPIHLGKNIWRIFSNWVGTTEYSVIIYPLKTKLSPENWWLKDEINVLFKWSLFRGHVGFRGGSVSFINHRGSTTGGSSQYRPADRKPAWHTATWRHLLEGGACFRVLGFVGCFFLAAHKQGYRVTTLHVGNGVETLQLCLSFFVYPKTGLKMSHMKGHFDLK